MNLPYLYKLNRLEINFVDYKRFINLSFQCLVSMLNKQKCILYEKLINIT